MHEVHGYVRCIRYISRPIIILKYSTTPLHSANLPQLKRPKKFLLCNNMVEQLQMIRGLNTKWHIGILEAFGPTVKGYELIPV